jgi:Ca2+-binding RTX toxin-like protein
VIVCNEGDDTLLGSTSNDYLDGGVGDDLLTGVQATTPAFGRDGSNLYYSS